MLVRFKGIIEKFILNKTITVSAVRIINLGKIVFSEKKDRLIPWEIENPQVHLYYVFQLQLILLLHFQSLSMEERVQLKLLTLKTTFVFAEMVF